MEESPKKPVRTAGIKCMRFMLYTLNVVYLTISLLMIIGASTFKVKFGEYYFTMWYSTLYSLPNLWIATGCLFALVSFFGIFATFKTSTMLLNLNALLLAFVFILQMSAAIIAFVLLPQTGRIAESLIESLMNEYFFNDRYRHTMDWIQQTFQCCGNNGPSNWLHFKRTTIFNDNDYSTEPSLVGIVPRSCCSYYTSDDYNCDFYYTGCRYAIRSIAFRSVFGVGSSALIIGLLQIFGVSCAVVLAGWVRRSKTKRDVERWSSHVNPTFEESGDMKLKLEKQIEADRGEINYM